MSSCSSQSQPAPSEALPVISVNGVIIEEEALANELQYHQNPDFNTVVQQAGQALVIKQLLLAEAKERGLYTSTENEEETLQKLLAQAVNSEEPNEQDCVRYFENNSDKFFTVPLMEVDHILLAAAKDDLPTREVAKLRYMRDVGDITEREYLRAGQLALGETPSQRREYITIALLIALNILVLVSIFIVATG